MQLQRYRNKNEKIDKKTAIKFESTQKKISKNKKVATYLESEQKINLLMDNINKILAQAIENDYR